MIVDGRVKGLPLVDYLAAKADIEDLSNLEEGMTAYSSDTDEFGAYDGVAWHWFDLDIPDHNDLGAIQGGAAAEYYHLDAADYDALVDVNAQLAALHTDGSPTFADVFVPDGGQFGIAGNELLTVNAAGTFAFSDISGVSVETGDWIGAGSGCAWLYDSVNGDISTTVNVGIGTTPTEAAHVDGRLAVSDEANTGRITRLYVSDPAEDEGRGMILSHNLKNDNTLDFTGSVGTRIIFSTSADVLFQSSDTGVGVRTITTNMFIQRSGGRVGIGITAPLAKCHADQASASGAIPVLALDQADISEEFINYLGASAASVANPVSTWTSGNTIQGFVRVGINNTFYWMPYYDSPTS